MPQANSRRPTLDMAAIRNRLATCEGPAYWRSLEELAGTAEFRDAVDAEFPAIGERFNDHSSRRDVLKLMAASLALMGLTGCFYKKPQEQIVPYTKIPDEMVPGEPMYFATAMVQDAYARGVLVLSREGRPLKIEGNPDHPASLGAASAIMQASILCMYDPDRARTITLSGRTHTWGNFITTVTNRLQGRVKDASGVRLLTCTTTSPTFIAQVQEFLKTYPGSQWHQYDPIHTPTGGKVEDIFQTPAETIHDFSKADVVLSLGSDFMLNHPAALRYSRQFIDGRRVRASNKKMNRLYVIESTMTITGSMADHRMAILPSRLEHMAQALAARLQAGAAGQENFSAAEKHWLDVAARDLAGAKSSLVIAGDDQPPAVRALAHTINQKLGNVGRSVNYIAPVASRPEHTLHDLVADMGAGKVDTLLIFGGNPAYDAPSDIPFAQALEAFSTQSFGENYTNLSVHLASHRNETSWSCQWHVPESHYLESWGDVRAYDGTASIIQPLIAPIFESKSQWEVMEALLGRPDRAGIEIIRGHWAKQAGNDLEKWWVQTLQRGVIDGTTAAPITPPPLRTDFATTPPAQGVEVLFTPDPSVLAGEYANNAWLQELPKPFIKLTWDNAVIINVRMAEQLGGDEGTFIDGNFVSVELNGKTIEAQIVLLPGQADNMITLTLGYGRTRGGVNLLEGTKPRGYNAYVLRSSTAPWIASGAKITNLHRIEPLAITRNHNVMSQEQGVPGIKPELKPHTIAQPSDSDDELELNNRRLVRTATLSDFIKSSEVIHDLDPEEKKPLLSLYPGWDYNHGLQWGMSIDQTACIGCNACIVACQAENNIAVVGKEQVKRYREMHWIRVDNYFAGPVDSPSVYHQPVPCMHCENAPCEYVCPVGATTHSDEGLNEMTYNRCIGTRYCSNNCPYKVRRFNFLLYSDYESETRKLQYNPDVTVRSRGVMEKCTYCVQRIDNTRIEMEKQVTALREQAEQATDPAEKQRLTDEATKRGHQVVRQLQTACQQSCPTNAIVFGDIRDDGADVTKLKAEPANYGLLTSLTTKPRTTYLARFTNPHPDLKPGTVS